MADRCPTRADPGAALSCPIGHRLLPSHRYPLPWRESRQGYHNGLRDRSTVISTRTPIQLPPKLLTMTERLRLARELMTAEQKPRRPAPTGTRIYRAIGPAEL